MKNDNYDVRGWALKCGAAYALQFKYKANEVLVECYQQLIANHEPKLWSIAITAVCELLDKHRIEFRISSEDERSIVCLMFEMLERIEEETVKNALTTGLCRLILSNYIVDEKQIASVFIEYFNPKAYPSTQQIMGLFFDQMHRLKRQGCLISALVPMFDLISTATHEREFLKIKLKNVIDFVITITKPTPDTSTEWHNQIALELVKIMHEYSGNKLVDVMSEQLKALEVVIHDEFKEQIRRPLHDLLENLSGVSNENVKRCWKKFGFKNSDRQNAHSSPGSDRRVSSPVIHSQRNASTIVTRSSTISRVSKNSNNENAQEQTNKGKEDQVGYFD